MHWIKIYILEQLLYVQALRNRDMRPAKVESNLYQYHLKQLIKDGWIIKRDKLYTLAPKGLAWADRYSSELRSTREQSKVVSIIMVRNNKDELLLMPRARQPFVGSLTFPSGKIKKGEPLKEAAERELNEKTGIVGIKLTFIGTTRSLVSKDTQVITDYIGYVWEGVMSDSCSDLPKEAAWQDLAYLQSNSMAYPGLVELARGVEEKKLPQELIVEL